ncbi:MAG TPA: Mur ligase family protein [Acidimicrobiia bacterium]
MNITEALRWLDAHVNLETGVGIPADRRVTAPTLERISQLVQLLGEPQTAYPVIHLTGTNGKTSVARMTSTLLAAAGVSVGTYTSPHLEQVNERISRDTDPIPDDALAGLVTRIADLEDFLDELPSYFEILSAAAFDWFSEIAVDAAVVEVGLGGTWDATNVVDGRVAVITNVSLDHVQYLGNDRASIATDKSGIIRPGATLVLGETDPDLRPIFERREPGAIVLRDRDFGVRGNQLAHGGRLLQLFTQQAEYRDVFLPLHGAHQADNAVMALAAAEAFLGTTIGDDIVHRAFASVTSPGRLEVVGHQPLVLLDGAHNVAGAEALVAALAEEFATGERTYVVGLLREKEPHEMLEALAVQRAERLVCTRPPSNRALGPDALARAAVDLGMAEDAIDIVDDVGGAVARAVEITPVDGQVVVSGSLYVVGAARAALVGDRAGAAVGSGPKSAGR